MKKHVLFILLSLLGCSCSPKDEMDEVIEKGLHFSIEQSKRMAELLWNRKDCLPRTLDKDGDLTTQNHLVDRLDYFEKMLKTSEETI